jgi:hypothetical protein
MGDDSVVENLILDVLEWLAKCDGSNEEAIDVWRVTKEQVQGRCMVKITSSGLALLEQRRPRKPEPSSTIR